MSGGGADAGPRSDDRITLHSSWTGIGAAALGTMCLVGLAVFALVAVGAAPVTLVLVVLAAVATLAVLFDMPIATTFDATGFERHTPLRWHRVDWADIDRLSRMRRTVRRPGASRGKGIVAMRNRRQMLLVDRTEGRREHLALRRIVGPDTADIYFAELGEPPANRTPTWVGRSRRWAPPDDPAA